MGPTLKYPTAAVDGGGPLNIWANPTRVGAVDGSTSDVTMPGGGDATNYLYCSTFGYAIPATAAIDGIKLEILASGTQAVTSSLRLTKTAGVPVGSDLGAGTDCFPVTTLDWTTYGGETELWGTTWTPAAINATGFGAGVQAANSTGGGSAGIDAIRITVYWHIGNQDVPKRYLYKVLTNTGAYIGNLPNVISEFGFTQDINTAGSQITIECAVSPDTSRLPSEALTDEAGNILTDENSSGLQSETTAPIVAPGNFNTNALIKNGNALKVFEYSYYYPNGKCMFLGQMERWEADFGGDGNDTIKILAYSDGQDLDNYLVRGNPYTYTLDQSNTTSNATAIISEGYSWDRYGQTWTVGTGVTNLGAINIALSGTANVTVKVFSSPTSYTELASVTKAISLGGITEVSFAFPVTIVTTPGNSLFFTVKVDSGQSCTIYYQNSNIYANGQMYNSNYGGGGGGAYASLTADLWFKTFSGAGSTIGTFTSLDPSTGMLKTFMDDYIARGGLISYASNSIDATGLILSYGLNTNTTFEAIRAVNSISPNGFYFYVDLGTDVLYFKKSKTVADITLTKGRHLSKIKFVATIENLRNQVYFTGGLVAGYNLYKTYQDATSMGLYKPKLDRKTDNRVTVSATADAIGGSALAEQKDESYQTVVSILDRTMDITLLKPGLILGFNGFGTFADNVLAQIVAVNYTPEVATLTLGILPKRLTPEFDKITRGLIAQQTIANPAIPS